MSGYKEMKYYVQHYPQYLSEGLSIGTQVKIRKENYKFPIQNIVITGLGGSGIGAEMVQDYLAPSLNIPIVIGKNYHLPNFINENSLVIVSSYSGDTEETLTAFKEAKDKNAQMVCVTSGGKLKDLAESNNLDIVLLPGGIPPRACVPISFSQILFVLNQLDLIGNDFIEEIENARLLIEKENQNIQEEAKNIAQDILGKIPVIYGNQCVQSVLTRWRQQLNENSKILAWERVLPEMNHNELVGWKDKNEDLSVLFLHTGFESQAIKNRFDICKEVVGAKASNIINIYAKGDSFLSVALYLTYLGDWLSVYLADLRGVDAVEVEVINYLKKSLSERAQ
ncbi:MAG TPA: bifunctional phosphoglucose/phosphomannose isomerase [Edaphocola sp.]|nr:bifunctional phosphoglucose/phosphomannose isomerase [Edaphocola sp.]